jgi:hypothetical protein
MFTLCCFLQIVDDFNWEMDDYEVCIGVCFAPVWYSRVVTHECPYENGLNHCVAMQDFADQKVKDEDLPEDEKEKFKVQH